MKTEKVKQGKTVKNRKSLDGSFMLFPLLLNIKLTKKSAENKSGSINKKRSPRENRQN